MTGPAGDRLKVDPGILLTDEFDARFGDSMATSRRRPRWILWLAAGLTVATGVLFWLRLDDEHPWSATSLMGSKLGSPAAETVIADDPEAASACVQVTHEQREGATVITLRFDGTVAGSAVSQLRLESPRARHVFKIRGILRSPDPLVRDLLTEHVRRLRFGQHRLEDDYRLHVVLDLVGDSQVTNYRTEGDQLIITVG